MAGTFIKNAGGDYALWLTDADEAYFFATLGDFASVTSVTAGAELPAEYQGYRQLDRGEALRASREAQELTFGTAELPIGIAGRKEAGEFAQRYVYRADVDAVLDNSASELFYANYQTDNSKTTMEIPCGPASSAEPVSKIMFDL